MIISENPRKTTLYRELGSVDIAALRNAVLAVPKEVWDEEDADKPNRFRELESARHIVFRFVSRLDDWRHSYDGRLWTEWRPLLNPVLAQATRIYGYARGDYPRVMIARLPAGGKILPHRDSNPAAKWPHKIHVPLLTNDKAVFFVDGVARHLVEGYAVEVNNMGVHAVKNDGDTDRIHLIFEYYDLDQPEPDWIRVKRSS